MSLAFIRAFPLTLTALVFVARAGGIGFILALALGLGGLDQLGETPKVYLSRGWLRVKDRGHPLSPAEQVGAQKIKGEAFLPEGGQVLGDGHCQEGLNIFHRPRLQRGVGGLKAGDDEVQIGGGL